MKHLSTAILVIMIATATAQTIEIDPKTGKYSTTSIVEVENQSMKQLYGKALTWAALTYSSANDAIQLKDAEAGRIILKGVSETYLFMKSGLIYHTAIIEFKDNRFRCTFTDFSYYSPYTGAIALESDMISKKKLINETQANTSAILSSLVNYLKTDNRDNW